MGLITSRQNASVKGVRELRLRKAREREGLFVAEGARLAVEAERSRAQVEAVIICPELLRSEAARVAAGALVLRGARKLEVSADVFAGIATRENPQGIAVVTRTTFSSINTLDPHAGLCWIALVSPQDPGNVGSILRTCDAVGAAGVILVGDSVDPYDPRSVRASMGGIFTRRLVRCSAQELVDWIRFHSINTVFVTGAAVDDYRSSRYPRPLLLVFGSEREGITLELPSAVQVSLPMSGTVDSLNLSVAVAVMLYEIFGRARPSNGSAISFD